MLSGLLHYSTSLKFSAMASSVGQRFEVCDTCEVHLSCFVQEHGNSHDKGSACFLYGVGLYDPKPLTLTPKRLHPNP